MTDHAVARRALIKGAGLGVGAGFAAAITPAHAERLAAAATADTAPAAIWSAEYWAHKGDVKLYMFRKRMGAPAASAKPLPVLFLVHGSSLSSRSSYDLRVPGKGEYSLMDVFAGYGFDVWTMDHEGYGRSSRTQGNSDIASGVEDLKAAMEVLKRETGRGRYHFFGESSGSIRAGAFAQNDPERVDRLILTAFTYKGNGAAEIERRQQHIAELRANPRRRRDAAMVHSIFSRDGHPEIYDPAVADALVASEMQFGDAVPSGTYLDMAANLPLVDPTRVTAPVLMTRGEWDGNSTNDDLLAFFRQLPNGDRQFTILPDTAHSEVFSKNRHLLFYAMKNFLAAPAPVAS
ncbi:MAG TPA: alpha/beta fold hydrolase [Xanthobacteraceae bacterium]|jgi:alpha-beta hydrolase superfamily lysophospholipase